MRTLGKTLLILGIGLSTTMIPCTGLAQQSFFDGFDDGVDPEFWRVYSNQPLFTIDASGGTVGIAKPVGGNGWGYWDFSFLCFEGEVVGDFEAAVSFSDLDITLTDVGCNAVSIETFFGGQIHSLVRQECETGGDTVGVWLDPPELWDGRTETAASGTLKVVRSGLTVISYFDGVEFHRTDLNADPVTDICFGIGNNHSLDAVSVRFDDFSLTGDDIQYPAGTWRKVAATSTASDGEGATALDFYPPRSEVAIAYTDPDTAELRVVRGTRDGATWSWTQPESAASAGRAVDLTYDARGDLWLSYLTGNDNRPNAMLAHWNGVDQTWTERRVDRGVKNWMTSMANLDGTSGSPSMAYGRDSGNLGQMMFVEGDLPPVIVDTGAAGEGGPWYGSGVGSFFSHAYAPDDSPAVAYSYLDELGWHWIKFASRSSGTWLPEIAYSYGGRVIRETSLAFRDNTPLIASVDAHHAPLVYCERNGDWECGDLHPGAFGGPVAMVDGAGTVIVTAYYHPGASRVPQLWMFSRPVGATGWHVKRLPWFSRGDGALDPNGNSAFCFWQGADLYLAYLDTGTCDSAIDCDDSNPCTDDSCEPGGECNHVFLSDGTPCGPSQYCCTGQCGSPQCTADIDCDDGDDCTTDSCSPGSIPECSAMCTFDPIPGCLTCLAKGEPCTTGDECCSGLCHPIKNTCK